MSGSGQKGLFLQFPWFRSGRVDLSEAMPPTVRWRKAGRGPPFSLALVDLFNDRAFARLNHIGSVIALDIAILTQRRGFPIDLLREGTDLHGIRQALPDPDPSGCGAAAGGALFYPGRTSVFADDLPIPFGKGCLVRYRRGRRRSAGAR